MSSVFDNIRQLTGVQYNSAEYAGDVLDAYVLRRAREEGVRLRSAATRSPEEWVYLGAKVRQPVAGLNNNVTYLDGASLYPNLMRALNVGPDTLVGVEDDLAESQWTEADCVNSFVDTRPVKHVESGEGWRQYTDGQYKMVYDDDKPKIRWRDDPVYDPIYYLHPDVRESFLRGSVQDLIDLKDEYRGTSTYGAMKAHVVNPIYGFSSELRQDYAGRFADWRIGESITLAGRNVLKYALDTATEQLDERVSGDPYIAIADTDGGGLCWPSAPTRAVMMDHVEEIIATMNDEGFPEFMSDTFGIDRDEHFMEFEVESYAPSLFVPAKNPSDPEDDSGVKKRYAEWVTIDDGEETDEISITGLEYTRSDVATVTQDVQYRFAELVLCEDRSTVMEALFPYLRDVHEQIGNGDYDLGDVAKRKGIGQRLSEYGSENRTPGPTYRGAKYARDVLDLPVGEGSKVKVVYVDRVRGDLPKHYSADTAEDSTLVDAIAVEDVSELPLDQLRIDWEKHRAKSLVEPMRPLLETMGWSWSGVLDGTEQSALGMY